MEFVGTIAAVFTTAAFIPQSIKTIKTRNTEGLSLSMYVCFTIGVFLWIIYGITTHARPVYIANALTFIFAVIILSVIISNKKKGKNEINRI